MTGVVWWIVAVSCVGARGAPPSLAVHAAPVAPTSLAVTTGVPLLWVDPDTGWVWDVDAETGLVPPS